MRDAAAIGRMIWYRQLFPRLGFFPVHKVATLIGFMLVFFTAYFLLLNFPAYPVTRIPVTALDRAIGFHPYSLVLYLTLWMYVSLAPGWIVARDELTAYFWACAGLALSGCVIFYFWPTATPTPDVDWSRYPSFGFLRSIDDAGNACPSLHVAFAVFSGIWADVLLRRMRGPVWVLAANGCWCLGIVYSTLGTKQHLVLDALAGAVLGLAWFLIHHRLMLPRLRSTRAPASVAAAARRQAGSEQV